MGIFAQTPEKSGRRGPAEEPPKVTNLIFPDHPNKLNRPCQPYK